MFQRVLGTNPNPKPESPPLLPLEAAQDRNGSWRFKCLDASATFGEAVGLRSNMRLCRLYRIFGHYIVVSILFSFIPI